MDILLSKVTQQAMNYAIRSGITLTASYAIKQSTRLLKQVPKSNSHDELQDLHQRLQGKIRIISPAIDMIELISARGNTSLESAVALTKDLRWEIQCFGQQMASVAATEEAAGGSNRSAAAGAARTELEVNSVISSMKRLLKRVEDAVPLINLAITTSGVSLSARLPPTVSPSRLLQASTLLNAGDMQYSMAPEQAVQIGPLLTLTLYMLFSGHVRPHDETSIRETTWKEVMHKCRAKIRRVPMRLVQPINPSASASSSPLADTEEMTTAVDISKPANADEYAYQIMFIEDLDDDRFHTVEGDLEPQGYDGVERAGIREIFPVFQIGKIFYADTGKVLNIGSEDSNSPVLLLKRDLEAQPPRSSVDILRTEEDIEAEEQTTSGKSNASRTTSGVTPWSLPPGLDPEWMALEIYNEAQDSEPEDDEADRLENTCSTRRDRSPGGQQLATSLANMKLDSDSNISLAKTAIPTFSPTTQTMDTLSPPAWVSNVPTSLSLLEVLLRLVALTEYLQTSHLSANDQWLNFFLEESKATGAEGDENARQKVRADARRRVGFDPYDESPVKRRGEEYQYQGASTTEYGWSNSPRSPRWSSPDISRLPENSGLWTPPSLRGRSATGSDQLGSTSPITASDHFDRKTWLKRNGESSKASPLRSQTEISDEGIGTSPNSNRAVAETKPI